jgi:two-component system sensor kinase FixL
LSMSEGIYGLSPEGTIHYANPAASQMTQWAEHELLDKNAFGLHFSTQASWLTLLSDPAAFADGKAIEVPHDRMRRQDDSSFDVALVLTPQYHGGALTGLVMVFRDITEQLKQVQELQETRKELQSQRDRISHIDRLSTMGEMTAGFAHEVNQPLTAITNYASVGRRLLDRDPLEREKLAITLEKLQTQAVRASEVIQRLRNFVQAPKGGKVVKNPNQLVHEVIELAEVDSRNNQVSIRFEEQPGLPAVNIDDIQIQQVALNLIRNAMEAMTDTPTQDQGVEIILSMTPAQQLRFAVTDQGKGLDAGAEDKLFLPFYTTKEEGMGIGLSVCASIIQQHGGEIGFQRNEPGTTFYFDLPVYQAAAAGA